MGMGIVSDEELEKEIKNGEAIPTHIKQIPTKGRTNVEVPEGLRKIIGEEGVVNGRTSAVELAKTFGISPSSASAYAHGATSTASYHSPDEGIKNHIDNAKEKISKKARTKLMLALNSITADKVRDIKVTEASAVAKDMSVIIKNMEPDKAKTPAETGPTFVFYAPTFKKEEFYDTMIVNE